MISLARCCKVGRLPIVGLGLGAFLVGCSKNTSVVSSPSESLDAQLIAAVPLAKKSGDIDLPVRFTQLETSETGVEFVNPIDLKHEMKRLYAFGYATGGIAIGDVNGDNLPDLFFSSGPGDNALFIQEESLQFRRKDSSVFNRTDQWGTGAAFADIDDDGDLDLYLCNYDSPNQLFVNDGAGNFSEESAGEFGLADRSASLMPTFADYDADGDLDLYVLTNAYVRDGGQPKDGVYLENGVPRMRHEYRKYYDTRFVGIRGNMRRDEIYPVGQRDRFFRNEGKDPQGRIRFADVSGRTGDIGVYPGKGLSATWWDYNNDGLLDLYAGNDFEDSDRLYRNLGPNASGVVTFKDVIQESVPHTTWYSMGADVADVNNDGLLDLFSVDMAATTHYKQKASMGDMSSKTWFMTSANPTQLMRNALFLNTGTDRLQEAAQMAGISKSDWSWAPKLADFDNDGRVDLFISNGMSRPFTQSDIIKNLPLNQLRFGKSEWDIFENYPPQKERNLAFVNKGDLKFEDVSADWGLDFEGMTYATAYGDLDRDGDLDLVTVNLDGPAHIYRNDSQEGQRVLVKLKGTDSNSHGIGAVVTVETEQGIQVRQNMPTTGFLSCNDSALHFGLGSETTIQRLSVRWPNGSTQHFENLEAGNLYTITEAGAADSVPESIGKPMFTASEKLNHAIHRERDFDDFALQPLLPNKLSQLGPCLAVGDVNGDGRDDLFLGGAAGQPGAIYLNHQARGFGPGINAPFAPDLECEDLGAAFLDADGDGDLDLYVVSGGNEAPVGSELLRDRLYLGDGRGVFEKAAGDRLPDLRDSGGSVATCDFDHDGDVDLFVGGRIIPGQYPLSPISRLLINNGSGTFTDETSTVAPGLEQSGMVTGAVWADVNGDGTEDLTLCSEWGSLVTWVNDQGTLTKHSSPGAEPLTGWWMSLSSGDIDNDGDVDFVATNFGLNTKYHASSEKPALLYYGQFGESPEMRLIEAEFENDILFPVRGKSCSTAAIPDLAQRFPSFDKFAGAALEEIYPSDRLENAHRFEANVLESGIFLNDGSGNFEFGPLPRIAQIAPSFGSALFDANADGNLDAYLAQNFFTPQLETGKMAGGLSQLLLGDGKGGFTPVTAKESGLIVPGDAKAVVITDVNVDGSPDIVVGINNGAVLTFENR